MKLNHLGAVLLSECWRDCGKIVYFYTDEVAVAENSDFKGKNVKGNVWHVEAILFYFFLISCKIPARCTILEDQKEKMNKFLLWFVLERWTLKKDKTYLLSQSGLKAFGQYREIHF